MRVGFALLVALCVSCASPSPRSTATPESGTVPAANTPAAGAQPSVIITADPQAVTGCRRITTTEQAYDVQQSEQWRKLQEEAARLGGNTVLVSTEGNRKAEIYSCSKP
jgi:hypothetical protein